MGWEVHDRGHTVREGERPEGSLVGDSHESKANSKVRLARNPPFSGLVLPAEDPSAGRGIGIECGVTHSLFIFKVGRTTEDRRGGLGEVEHRIHVFFFLVVPFWF